MYKSEIDVLLDSFAPIALNEMDEVSLMNRVETKYIFSAGKLPLILNQLSDCYNILEIDTIRCFAYKTTYLDTPEDLFFHQQVTGKLNRYKVRYRRYESTGDSFLEIKKKTNRNRTIKWRIVNSLSLDSFDKSASGFIREYLPYNGLILNPVLVNEFDRITIVNIEFKERITMDYNLTFNSFDGNKSELPFLSIAELKRERHSGTSLFGTIMKNMHIQPNRFSKYSIGSALTREIARKNTLKSNMLIIKKIENEYN